MRAKEEAFRLLEAALSIASSGADEAEVSLGGGDLGVTAFAQNQIQPSIEQSVEVLGVRVASHGRVVRVTTTDLSTQGMKEAAQQARTRAEHLPEKAQAVPFAEPQHYDLTDAYDPEAELFRALERTALAGRAIILGHKHSLWASGQVMSRRGSLDASGFPGVYAMANTRGLLAYHPETRVGFQLSLRGRNGASGWAEDESFALSAIDSEVMIKSAQRRAQVAAERRKLEPGQHVAVLDPSCVGSLITALGRCCGAAATRSGATFLSEKIGERIASSSISLADDYAHPLHRGAPFDLDGVARRRVQIIDKGVAKGPVWSHGSAVKWQAEATGHQFYDPELGEVEAARHLILDGGSATLSDLIGSTKRGVYIGRIGAVRLIDPRRVLVTAATREGLFLIENGDVVAPLTGMRFTVSVLDLLTRVESMGGVVWSQGSVVPSMKVEIPLEAR